MKAITKATVLEVLRDRKDQLESNLRYYDKRNSEVNLAIGRQLMAIENALFEVSREETED